MEAHDRSLSGLARFSLEISSKGNKQLASTSRLRILNSLELSIFKLDKLATLNRILRESSWLVTTILEIHINLDSALATLNNLCFLLVRVNLDV
jgi:hypothetical protein